MSRIVLSTFGSLGDLHPYLAVGEALRRRGHAVVLATHPDYAAAAAEAGLEHAPVRPGLADFADLGDAVRRAMDLRGGSLYVLRELVLAPLRAATEDALGACAGADLAVSHVLSLSTVLAAETLGVPRVHSALQPMTMWSAYDPPLLPLLPAGGWLRAHAGPRAWSLVWAIGRATTRRWFGEVAALRRELGLPAARAHPLLQMFSPLGNLALFSPRFGPPQPDWPPRTVATGFPAWTHGGPLDPALEAFLAAGEPPVVFTLGSAAVLHGGDFYDHALAAAHATGVRSVLLVGDNPANVPAGAAGDPRVAVVPYASHAAIFPRAAAVVHQGGVGTTARALAAGRPMLVVPHSHDQPDNARRCAALGVAHVVPRGRWTTARASAELAALLSDRALAARAVGLGGAIAAERGAERAADALEAALAGRLASRGGAA